VSYRPPDYLAIARRALAERERGLSEEASTEEPAAPTLPAHRVSAAGACPTCGATSDELVVVRARRAMLAAWDEWDRHTRGCRTCVPHRVERCTEGERLAGEYFDRWAAYMAAVGEEVSRSA
jgi:hypothetical protein